MEGVWMALPNDLWLESDHDKIVDGDLEIEPT